MDKISLKKILLELCVILDLIISIITVFIAACGVFWAYIFDNSLEKCKDIIKESLDSIIYTNLIFLTFFIIFLLITYFSSLVRKNNTIGNKKDYYRELPNKYPPAIASMIYDESIEITTDYPATLLNLYNKGVIKIEKNENGDLLFKKNKEDELQYLYEHEQYVYRCIINGLGFSNNKFKNLLIEDARRIGLIDTSKINRNIITKIIIILAIYICKTLLEKINIQNSVFNIIKNINVGILSISIYALIAFYIYDIITKKFIRTKFGMQEAKLWNDFKNYLRDYTLISEKEMDYVTILDEFIPYALVLNEGKAIEKYIEKNEVYRKIFYRE